jgi:hypothetical protein
VKVTIDGANKLIIVDNAITSLDVQVDLYSDWKGWMKLSDNSKFLPAMRTVGGDPTTGVKSVAPYFFLTNGWKLRPYEGDHTLTIDGNLFVDEPGTYGYNLTVPTLGNYTVTINLATTSDAIQLATGSGLDTAEHDQLMDTLTDSSFETDLTVKQALRVALSSLAGNITIQDGKLVFKGVNSSKTRMQGTVSSTSRNIEVIDGTP